MRYLLITSILSINLFLFADDTVSMQMIHPTLKKSQETPLEEEPQKEERSIFFHTFADYLYFKGSSNGIQYNLTLDVNPNSVNSPKTYFKWKSGFRAGIGVLLDKKDVDITTFWTHYKSKSNYVKGQFQNNQWEVKFDLIDLKFAQKLIISKYFHLTPYLAPEISFVDQTLTNYINIVEEFRSLLVDVKSTRDFFGGGAKIGIDSDWFLFDQFEIFANLSLGMLFGKFKLKEQNIQESTDEGQPPRFININETYYRKNTIPNIQMILGLAYNQQITDTFKMTFHAGYELNYYWNMCATYTLTIPIPFANADLELSGLNVGIDLLF